MATTVPVTYNATKWDWPMQGTDGVVNIYNDTERFEVGLECQFFAPSEIEVKVSGQEVYIHCHHDERSDQFGRVTREINRCYHLPQDVDPSTIKSHLTARGVLKITANKAK